MKLLAPGCLLILSFFLFLGYVDWEVEFNQPICGFPNNSRLQIGSHRKLAVSGSVYFFAVPTLKSTRCSNVGKLNSTYIECYPSNKIKNLPFCRLAHTEVPLCLGVIFNISGLINYQPTLRFCVGT